MSRLLLLGIAAATLAGCAHTAPAGAVLPSGAQDPPTVPQPAPDPAAPVVAREFAVYALSRGKGLPDETRAALAAAREVFADLRSKGQVVRVVEQTMGLEGERRVCAEFVDASAAEAAREQILSQSAGTELFNVVIEACDRTSQRQGEKEP